MRRTATMLAMVAAVGCFNLLPATDRRDGAIDAPTRDAPDAAKTDVADEVSADITDVVSLDAPDVVSLDAPDVVSPDAPDVVSPDAPDVVTSDIVDAATIDAPEAAVDGGVRDAPLVDTPSGIDVTDASDGRVPLPRIGSGRYHTCVLRTTGALRCWGWNTDGVLGNRGASSMGLPVAVDQTFFDGADLEGEFDAIFVRTTSGAAWGWGLNSNGQLGVGGGPSRNYPSRYAGFIDLVSVAAGGAHACAVRATGEVVCSGANNFGQIGNTTRGNFASPVPVSGITDAAEVSAGENFTCARRSGGSVLCWGFNTYGQLGGGSSWIDAGVDPGATRVTVMGLSDAVELSSYNQSTCARRIGGTVVCWGANDEGQLGDGTRSHRAMPVAVVGLTNVVTLSVGEFHACAVTSAGQVSCWGGGGAGQLGDRSTNRSTTPVPVFGLTDVVDVACGGSHSCAVKRNGDVWCWGDNYAGQIGRPSSTMDYLQPVQVTFSN